MRFSLEKQLTSELNNVWGAFEPDTFEEQLKKHPILAEGYCQDTLSNELTIALFNKGKAIQQKYADTTYKCVHHLVPKNLNIAHEELFFDLIQTGIQKAIVEFKAKKMQSVELVNCIITIVQNDYQHAIETHLLLSLAERKQAYNALGYLVFDEFDYWTSILKKINKQHHSVYVMDLMETALEDVFLKFEAHQANQGMKPFEIKNEINQAFIRAYYKTTKNPNYILTEDVEKFMPIHINDNPSLNQMIKPFIGQAFKAVIDDCITASIHKDCFCSEMFEKIMIKIQISKKRTMDDIKLVSVYDQYQTVVAALMRFKNADDAKKENLATVYTLCQQSYEGKKLEAKTLHVWLRQQVRRNNCFKNLLERSQQFFNQSNS
jgi:hypothetical protein